MAAVRIMKDTSRIGDEPKKTNSWSTKMAFRPFKNNIEMLQTIEYDLEADEKFGFSFGKVDDVIDADVKDDTDISSENDFSHASLKPGRSIG